MLGYGRENRVKTILFTVLPRKRVIRAEFNT